MINYEEILERTKHIPSSVYEPEQALWLKHLSGLPGNPFIVDFGTGWGKSAASLALACPQATILTFDIADTYVRQRNVQNHNEYTDAVQDYLKRAGVENVTHYILNSIEVNPAQFLAEKFGKTRIDVLNIDSDHTYETTKKEMFAWIPLVKTDGIVMFHDYEHPNAPGVGEAIHELVSYVDGENDYRGEDKPFKLELIEKAYHPKVTTALFIKR